MRLLLGCFLSLTWSILYGEGFLSWEMGNMGLPRACRARWEALCWVERVCGAEQGQTMAGCLLNCISACWYELLCWRASAPWNQLLLVSFKIFFPPLRAQRCNSPSHRAVIRSGNFLQPVVDQGASRNRGEVGSRQTRGRETQDSLAFSTLVGCCCVEFRLRVHRFIWTPTP